MPIPQRTKGRVEHGECRDCRTFCDKLIEPAGCVAQGCTYLYTYFDHLSEARYMGCMKGVFGCEIDVDSFERAQAGGGFGGIKVSGRPLPRCEFRVEPAYEGEGPEYACRNPRFFDLDDRGPEAIRAFDLRDALA